MASGKKAGNLAVIYWCSFGSVLQLNYFIPSSPEDQRSPRKKGMEMYSAIEAENKPISQT